MTLFHIQGVPVKVHWTFLLLGAWFARVWWVQDAATALSTAVWILPLFASVLFHEVGHMVVGGHYGIHAQAIVVLPVGGATQFAAQRLSPRVDVVMSLAGPMASLLLGAICLVAWLITGWQPAFVLGALNVLLGLSNLMPVFPMDGGRVLRSLLVQAVGLQRGNVVALAVGALFAATFGLLGWIWTLPELVMLAIFMALMQWREHQVVVLMRHRAA